MAEDLHIPDSTDKETIYQSLIPQLKGLLLGEDDFIANLSNIMAALKTGFDFLWVGCYFVKGDELVLGPFQGPVACTRIKYGKGVCGTAWKTKEIQLVDDVETFPGHIACSSLTRSEIVLPVFDNNNQVVLVLDIDSAKLKDFDHIDKKYLQEIVYLIQEKINPC